MELEDVKTGFNIAVFKKNAMITILYYFNWRTPQVMACLALNNKNAKRWNFTTKQAYINYLNEDVT